MDDSERYIIAAMMPGIAGVSLIVVIGPWALIPLGISVALLVVPIIRQL